jgi:hypothetical protein
MIQKIPTIGVINTTITKEAIATTMLPITAFIATTILPLTAFIRTPMLLLTIVTETLMVRRPRLISIHLLTRAAQIIIRGTIRDHLRKLSLLTPKTNSKQRTLPPLLLSYQLPVDSLFLPELVLFSNRYGPSTKLQLRMSSIEFDSIQK